jgi:sortase A
VWRGLLAKLGIALVVLGALGLAFVAFQLWGTGLLQARHQAALRSQFDASLPPEAQHWSTHVHSVGAPRTAPTASGPATGRPVGTIQIPSIGLDQVIVEGVGEGQLQLGPGHYPETPLPGEAGNAGIAGHRTTWGRPFYDLDELVPGDAIVITTTQGRFTYDMTSFQVVDPTDVSVLDPTADPTLTLTTCNPRFSAAQRLVVHARLVASTLPTSSPAPLATPAPRTVATPSLDPAQGSWLPALAWGTGCALLAAAVLVAVRRLSARWARALTVVAGAGAFAVGLFFFFAALSQLLPANY